MHPRPIAFPHAACQRAKALPKALIVLGADTFSEAVASARREIDRGPFCRCCVSAHVHLTRFVGSTLFLDDDPRQLQLAIPPEERLKWTPRVLAACIVLYGRARVELRHGAQS
jgi:hypothetical protein